MAPTKQKSENHLKSILTYLDPKMIYKLICNFLFNKDYFLFTAALLFIAEIIVNIGVIWKIQYTEIDWEAYMSEVEGFLNGTYDYMKLE